MTLIALPGPIAYSPFRINALINHINTSLNSSAVVAIRSVYVHYADVSPESGILKQQPVASSDNTLESKPLSKLDLLNVLLEYDSKPDTSDPLTQALLDSISPSSHAAIAGDSASSLPENTYLLRVIPRPGTISPWSSKATNIAQVCGLGDDVNRIERGIDFIFQVRKSFPFDEYLKSGVFLDYVYDRMTQVCLSSIYLFSSATLTISYLSFSTYLITRQLTTSFLLIMSQNHLFTLLVTVFPKLIRI